MISKDIYSGISKEMVATDLSKSVKNCQSEKPINLIIHLLYV